MRRFRVSLTAGQRKVLGVCLVGLTVLGVLVLVYLGCADRQRRIEAVLNAQAPTSTPVIESSGSPTPVSDLGEEGSPTLSPTGSATPSQFWRDYIHKQPGWSWEDCVEGVSCISVSNFWWAGTPEGHYEGLWFCLRNLTEQTITVFPEDVTEAGYCEGIVDEWGLTTEQTFVRVEVAGISKPLEAATLKPGAWAKGEVVFFLPNGCTSFWIDYDGEAGPWGISLAQVLMKALDAAKSR